MSPPETRLYSYLADWFHLLTAPADYADGARFDAVLVHDVEESAVRLDVRTSTRARATTSVSSTRGARVR
jgi:hypothetical protein